MNSDFRYTYNLLKNYHSDFKEELVYKQLMINLISTCEDCFLRSCRVGHFTASAFLLNKELTHILLMHHTKLDKWMQLGGHCDGDTNILNVAIKEAREESGIDKIKPLRSEIFDLDIHLIPPRKQDEAHYHFDIRFLLHAYDNNDFRKNKESKELRWVKKDAQNFPTVNDSIIRMLKKLAKSIFYP